MECELHFYVSFAMTLVANKRIKLFLALEVVGHADDDYPLFEEECAFEH